MVVSSASDSQPSAEEDHPMNDGNMISTGGPRQDSTYTEHTIGILLSIVALGCKYSHLLIQNILS